MPPCFYVVLRMGMPAMFVCACVPFECVRNVCSYLSPGLPWLAPIQGAAQLSLLRSLARPPRLPPPHPAASLRISSPSLWSPSRDPLSNVIVFIHLLVCGPSPPWSAHSTEAGSAPLLSVCVPAAQRGLRAHSALMTRAG